jgi:hypothetical protein
MPTSAWRQRAVDRSGDAPVEAALNAAMRSTRAPRQAGASVAHTVVMPAAAAKNARIHQSIAISSARGTVGGTRVRSAGAMSAARITPNPAPASESTTPSVMS